MNKTCVVCGKALSGLQRKYCSKKCKHKSSNVKHQNYVAQQRRGWTRKSKLVIAKGGKCSACGYSKSLSAISFHHRAPSEKSFQIDIRKCSNSTWEVLVNEASKCDLLCMNCHMELRYSDNPYHTIHLESPNN